MPDTFIPSEPLRAQLESFLTHIQRQTGVPGVSAAISACGWRASACVGSTHTGSRAALADASRFHLGCAAELLQAIVVLELVRTRILRLDAAIGEYIDELRGTAIGSAVTLRHLLSHTGGYRGTTPVDAGTRDLTWRSLLEDLRATQQLFPPGTVFSHEHTGAILLGAIVARVTAHTTLELIEAMLLRPLAIQAGMLDADAHSAGHHLFEARSRAFRPVSRPAPHADRLDVLDCWEASFSNLTLAPPDAVRVLETLLTPAAAAHPFDLLVATETRNQLQQQAIALPPTVAGPLAEILPTGFTLGCGILRGGYLGRSSVSYGQCVGLRFDPARRIAIAVGVNAMLPYVRDLILICIARILRDADPPAEQPPRLGLDLAELAGEYDGPGGRRARVELRYGHLMCEIRPRGTVTALRAELSIDASGRLAMCAGAPNLAIGFFREASTSGIGMQIGPHAYRYMRRC